MAEATVNPLLEESKEEAPPVDAGAGFAESSAAYRRFVFVAALAFAGTTLALGVVWPVEKHDFQKLSCVPQAEVSHFIAAAAGEAAPYAWTAVCREKRADCRRARTASIAAATAYCGARNVTGCAPLAEAASRGLPPPTSLRRRGAAATTRARGRGRGARGLVRRATDGPALRGRRRLRDADDEGGRRALRGSAACEAAERFYDDPSRYCANSSVHHAQTCATAKRFAKDVAANVSAYCVKQGSVAAKACKALNASLHDRGHWTEYCAYSLGNLPHYLECKAVKAAIKVALDEKVCKKGPNYQKLCDAGYAIAARWGNATAPVPIYDAALQVAELYCHSGDCGAETDATPLQRLEGGFGLEAAQDVIRDVPAVCGAWPATAAVCANVTAALKTYCGNSSVHNLECAWLQELTAFNLSRPQPWNVSRGDDLFVKTWAAADALCAEPPTTAKAFARAAFAPPPHEADRPKVLDLALPSPADVRKYACLAVASIDKAADQCPDVLPLVAAAEAGHAA
ncbi:hypothetical protein JL720_10879 [Aureococcus anophagefferens]|nr:hypothetical protein JL720_10879 [Aureococcus anophagefferens]